MEQKPSAGTPLGRSPRLQRIPARLLGLGFRPEHIQSPVV